MNNLAVHAKQMRQRIYQHMLKTRGRKYRSFLRYLRFFKYISFAPARGEFLESYYTLMRYLDDVVDGDAVLPAGYNCGTDYITDKIKFSRNPAGPADEVDYLMLHCFEVAKRFGCEFADETADILSSLLFDANRRGRLIIFPEKELKQHFHILDIRGTIRATLKVFKEDPAKYTFLEPLGTASRFQFDLEDFDDDIRAGYVNISSEDCSAFGISPADLHNSNGKPVQAWFRHHAGQGMELLKEHHRLLPLGKFSLLAKATFPLVYENPARKIFQQFLKT